MRYLLDSDVVISVLAGDVATSAYMDRLAPEGVAISTVTYMEVLQGIMAGDDPLEAERAFEAFLASVNVLPLSRDIARRCAELRVELVRSGKRVRQRALDLIVAATALHHELELVTRNVGDYDDIADLKLA